MASVHRTLFHITLAILLVQSPNVSCDNASSVHRIREGSRLSPKETAFVTSRTKHVLGQLKRVCKNNSLTEADIPRIALCCSGGGYRAFISLAGFLDGLKKTRLLDTVMYMSTLSGSAWFSTAWILSEQSIWKFRQFCHTVGEHGIWCNSDEVNTALEKLKEHRAAYDQKSCIIDWYGALLANTMLRFLGPDRFTKSFGDLATSLNSCRNPYPIATAVYLSEKNRYEWMEFTPHEIGSPHMNCAAPTHLAGKHFFKGASVDPTPAITAGYAMGIFGSVFSGGLRDFVDHLPDWIRNIETLGFYKRLKGWAQSSSLANLKFAPSAVANFGRDLPCCPMQDKKYLTLVDGGFSAQLPMKSLLREEREVDIIIIFDIVYTTSTLRNGLIQAHTQALESNMPFPDIDHNQIKHENISIFEDASNPACPTVIYLPLKRHDSYRPWLNPQTTKYCRPTNFDYSKKQAKELATLGEHIATSHSKEILDTIKKVIAQKQSTR